MLKYTLPNLNPLIKCRPHAWTRTEQLSFRAKDVYHIKFPRVSKAFYYMTICEMMNEISKHLATLREFITYRCWLQKEK